MKAVILAAGEGKRLKKYTRDIPKGMLRVRGRSLLERQISVYRACGVDAITVVRGFAGDTIAFSDITYYDNPRWSETNMVQSLLCSRKEFDDDVIVSYADIVFTHDLLTSMIQDKHPIGVAVDTDWKAYWTKRYGRIDFDTESLAMDEGGSIVSLGMSDPPIEEIDGRYVGVLRFSKDVLQEIANLCDELERTSWDLPWQQSGQPFRQAYMTDLLQELIDRGRQVHAVQVQGGWLEFDTNEDYETQKDWDVEPLHAS